MWNVYLVTVIVLMTSGIQGGGAMADKKRFCAREIANLDWQKECPACGSDGIDTGKRVPLDQVPLFETRPEMASEVYDHNFEAREYKCPNGHGFTLIVNRNEIAKSHGGVYDPKKKDDK